MSAQTHKSIDYRRNVIDLEVEKRPFFKTEKSSFELTKGFSYCYFFKTKLTDAACGGSAGRSSSCVPFMFPVLFCFVLFSSMDFLPPDRARLSRYYISVLLFLFLAPTFSFKNNKKMIMAAFYRLVCLTTTLFDYSGKTRKGATLLLCNFPRAAVHSFIECDSQSHSISNYILISLAK